MNDKNAVVIPDRGVHIEIESLFFSYPSRPECSVLKDVSISIPPCKIIVFAGKSGSGKSTLLSIIAGLYVNQSGEVSIAGSKLNSHNHSILKELIGMVEQTSGLFSGSVLENISYGKHDATVEEAKLAARAANAGEFIDKLPDKYNSQIGWNGSRLSGGQQARLALARALIKDPR